MKLEAGQRGVQFNDLNEIDVNGVPMKLKGYIDLLVFSVPVMVKTSTRSTLWRVSDTCELGARFLGSKLALATRSRAQRVRRRRARRDE